MVLIIYIPFLLYSNVKFKLVNIIWLLIILILIICIYFSRLKCIQWNEWIIIIINHNIYNSCEPTRRKRQPIFSFCNPPVENHWSKTHTPAWLYFLTSVDLLQRRAAHRCLLTGTRPAGIRVWPEIRVVRLLLCSLFTAALSSASVLS